MQQVGASDTREHVSLSSTPFRLPNTADGTGPKRLAEVADPANSPVSMMSADQRTVMSLLRTRIGGATVESVAEATGLSISLAGRCLEALEQGGLARPEVRRVLWGYGTVLARLWELSLTDRCVEALMHLPWTVPEESATPERVPPQFWSLFSSGAHPAELRLPRDAVAVAGRMLDSADVAARAWGLTNLPISALRQLRAARGYETGPNAVSLDVAIAHRPNA